MAKFTIVVQVGYRTEIEVEADDLRDAMATVQEEVDLPHGSAEGIISRRGDEIIDWKFNGAEWFRLEGE